MNLPVVSIIIPSYNHALFIEQAIQCALGQSYQNFELLISDDCSQDTSREKIEKYQDTRIRTFFLEENIGPCENLKFLITHARGNYIALLNSDDLWEHNKLEKQVQLLESQPQYAACFTWADFVDNDLVALTKADFASSEIFTVKNRSKEEWFHHFFYHSNCLCHPSVLIKRSVYESIGFYNPAFRQLPDFDFWCRLVQQYELFVLPEKLTHLRWHTNGISENTSSISDDNHARIINESLFFFYREISNMDDDSLKKVFSKELIYADLTNKDEINCEKFMILFKNNYWGHEGKIMAVQYYYEFLSNKPCIDLLTRRYNFALNDWFDLTKEYGIGGESIRYRKAEDALINAAIENRQSSTENEKIKAAITAKDQIILKNEQASVLREQQITNLSNELLKYVQYVEKLNSSLPFRIYHKLKNILKWR